MPRRTDRKLYLDDIATLAGVLPATIAGYRSRGVPPMPEPDGHDLERGHARPWWWESTAKAWLASRRGKGWRSGATD